MKSGAKFLTCNRCLREVPRGLAVKVGKSVYCTYRCLAEASQQGLEETKSCVDVKK